MKPPDLSKFSPTEVLLVEHAVLSCVVKALLATHPDPARAQLLFDQLFAQISAGALVSGTSLEQASLARAFAEKMFEIQPQKRL